MQGLNNRLVYQGDNLEVLRQCIHDKSIDLIYLDPPFNSRTNYNISFKRDADGIGSECSLHFPTCGVGTQIIVMSTLT